MTKIWFSVLSLLFVVCVVAYIGRQRTANELGLRKALDFADVTLCVHAAWLLALHAAVAGPPLLRDIVQAGMLILVYIEPLFALMAILISVPSLFVTTSRDGWKYAVVQGGLLIVGGACALMQIAATGPGVP